MLPVAPVTMADGIVIELYVFSYNSKVEKHESKNRRKHYGNHDV